MPCDRVTITQAEWDSGGVIEYYTRETMPDVRELARQFRP
jgi:hypothetical protein